MEKLEAGAKAPKFDLAADGGGRVKLSDFAGKKLVLYFYPADDTSGCTLEAIDFTTLLPDFLKANTAIVGVSPDSAESHDKFKAKHKLGLTLAADPDRKAIDAYGLWVEKNNYGKKYMGVERATFLIDRTGKIARAWHNVRVKGHAEDVLEAAKSL
ncbi:MAG TPA: peroxiredoxin [Bauldia sp.]|nr:peroxiredoxin [Bauldia sp.]